MGVYSNKAEFESHLLRIVASTQALVEYSAPLAATTQFSRTLKEFGNELIVLFPIRLLDFNTEQSVVKPLRREEMGETNSNLPLSQAARLCAAERGSAMIVPLLDRKELAAGLTLASLNGIAFKLKNERKWKISFGYC